MKILQILSSLNRISGVANVVMNYYRLLKDKVVFDFILYGEVEDSLTKEAESYGSTIYYIPKFSMTTYGKYKKQIDEFFAKHAAEYDLVHIHELMSQRVIIPIAHKYGLKVVIHSHGEYPGRKLVGTVKAIRNRFLFKGFDVNADYYLACGELAAAAFKRQKNVTVLKNGVDIRRFYNAGNLRDEYGISKKTFVVGSAGRIVYQKNPFDIIKIYAAVHRKYPDSVLLMAGEADDPGYMRQVKEVIHKENVEDSVKLIGNCSRMPELMNSFDVFLIPSLFEGLPVTAVEAQAAGLPCFCSENISQETNISGNVKFLPLSLSHDEWADAILASKKISKEEVVSTFTQRGYNLESNAETLLEIYRHVSTRENLHRTNNAKTE